MAEAEEKGGDRSLLSRPISHADPGASKAGSAAIDVDGALPSGPISRADPGASRAGSEAVEADGRDVATRVLFAATWGPAHRYAGTGSRWDLLVVLR